MSRLWERVERRDKQQDRVGKREREKVETESESPDVFSFIASQLWRPWTFTLSTFVMLSPLHPLRYCRLSVTKAAALLLSHSLSHTSPFSHSLSLSLFQNDLCLSLCKQTLYTTSIACSFYVSHTLREKQVKHDLSSHRVPARAMAWLQTSTITSSTIVNAKDNQTTLIA